MLKVYCAHPITGLTWDQVSSYYTHIKKVFQEAGFEVYQPMTAKKAIKAEVTKEGTFKAGDFRKSVATNHAIVERDRWMVQHCDLLYLDLTGAKTVSIGCMMELAWAHILGRYTIVVMENDNIHKHAFVVETADILLSSEEEAFEYLNTFVKQDI